MCMTGVTRWSTVSAVTAKWEFRAAAPHEELMRRAQDYQMEPADDAVGNQHVVSQVLLKRFAAPVPAKGLMLVPHHVVYGPGRPRGVRGCGKAANFLRVASGSAERIWKDTEDRLPAAIDAALAGGIHAFPDHVATIKDALALHYVRGYRFLETHVRAYATAEDDVRAEMLRTRPQLLANVFRQRTGLEPAGVGALESVMEPTFEAWRQIEATGALARATIEDAFERVRDGIRSVPLQIGHTSVGRTLLISDAPAVTLRIEPSSRTFTIDMALGDANTLVLPLTPRCVAALGDHDDEATLPPDTVQMLNEAQLLGARQYVYYAPGSRLNGEVYHWLRTNPRAARSMPRPRATPSDT